MVEEKMNPKKKEVFTGKGFGKKVENFLNHIKMRLGDVFYNSFGSIDNFCNLLSKIEQYSTPYGIDDGLIGTHRKEGMYGFVKPKRNEYGEITFDKEKPKYNKIYSEGGYFIVEYEGKKGLFNDKGEEILPPIYDEIRVIDDFIFYKEGDFRWMMDEDRNILIVPDLGYTEFKVIDNFIFFKNKKRDSWVMMNKKTKKLIIPEPGYTEILQDRTLKLLGYRVVIIKSKDDKIGLLSTKDGRVIFEPSYDKYSIDFMGNRIIFENTSTGESDYYEEVSEDN